MTQFTPIKIGEKMFFLSPSGKVDNIRVSRIDIVVTVKGEEIKYENKPAKECFGSKNECIDNAIYNLQQQRDM